LICFLFTHLHGQGVSTSGDGDGDGDVDFQHRRLLSTSSPSSIMLVGMSYTRRAEMNFIQKGKLHGGKVYSILILVPDSFLNEHAVHIHFSKMLKWVSQMPMRRVGARLRRSLDVSMESLYFETKRNDDKRDSQSC